MMIVVLSCMAQTPNDVMLLKNPKFRMTETMVSTAVRLIGVVAALSA